VPEQVDSKSEVVIDKEGDGFSITALAVPIFDGGNMGVRRRQLHAVVVQMMPADGYAGILKGRSRPWTSWSVWKSCSRVDTSTVRSSCCACAGIFGSCLRDLVEMMAERGLSLAHTTIMRWVQHYTPDFEKRWHRHALAVGRSWRVDETYVKIRGVWHYLYRAVDRSGRTVDFRLSAGRDVAAAKAFFRKAIKRQQRPPHTITLDGYAASHRAVRELKADGSPPTETKLRSSKYLNNLIEHRNSFRHSRRIAYHCDNAMRARYSQTMVAAANAVISAVS
jgi:transposase-like protein